MPELTVKPPSVQAVSAALKKVNISVHKPEWNSGNHASVYKTSSGVNIDYRPREGAFNSKSPLHGERELWLCKIAQHLRTAGFNATLIQDNNKNVSLYVIPVGEEEPLQITVADVKDIIRDRRVEEIKARMESNIVAMNDAMRPFMVEQASLEKLLSAIELKGN